MGKLIRLAGHARGPSGCVRASRSNVTPCILLFFASSTSSGQRLGGIPRIRQLPTTGRSVPSALATAVRPPRSLMSLSTDMPMIYFTGREHVKRHDLAGDIHTGVGTMRPMPKTVDTVAKRLAVMHDALGITQAEVCRATGIKPNRYSQYVSGKRPLTLDAAMKIADACGVTLDWLFRDNAETLTFQTLQKIRRIAA